MVSKILTYVSYGLRFGFTKDSHYIRYLSTIVLYFNNAVDNTSEFSLSTQQCTAGIQVPYSFLIRKE